MCDSLAAQFDDEEKLFHVFDQLHNELGDDGLQMLSGNNAFSSRMQCPNFLAAVLQMGSLVQPKTVRKAFNKNNAALMKKVPALLTKLRLATNKEKFMAQFFHNPQKRDQMLRKVAAL